MNGVFMASKHELATEKTLKEILVIVTAILKKLG